MADNARDKLLGVLRLNTAQLEQDINKANEALTYVGKDSRISADLRKRISDAVVSGIKDGIKNANALGLQLKVTLKGGNRGGNSGSGSNRSYQHLLGNSSVNDLIGAGGAKTGQTETFDGLGNRIIKTITAVNQAGQQIRATLDDMGYVARYSINEISNNANEAKVKLAEMKSTVADLKTAYQEWVTVAKNPDSSAEKFDIAKQKVVELTDKFRQLSQDSKVYTDLGLQVAGFTAQISSGERVISSFSEKLDAATNVANLEKWEAEQEELKKSYEEQARIIVEIGNAQARVHTSSGEQKKAAEDLLSTRREELQKAQEVTNKILETNEALKNSKTYLDGNEKVQEAWKTAAEQTSAAMAKSNDAARASDATKYVQALQSEKTIKSSITGIDKQLITATGQQKQTLLQARKEEENRLLVNSNLQKKLLERLGYSKQEIEELRRAQGLESQRLKDEAALNELRRKNTLAGKFEDAMGNIPMMMTNSLVMSATNAIAQLPIQAVKQFWNNAWEYATQYYDRMNEIRIVTLKSEDDANKLSDSFRNMAHELSVSSNEIAEAATIFYRQGLDDGQVSERLQATIMYAKTAGVEAENAANKITSVINSISTDARGVEMSAQRVADVFLYLGDNAASSGEEIGTAMQRSAALADTAGVSFEMLGAMIATVSERTRQDAGTIGTALNAIMSRLTSVKQKGYNEEDETKINDVAKALSRVNVQLTDGQGQWRRIEDIFMDVAKVWDTLDDKTQNYLATVMAGVRQQNVFRNLMADLSQVTEGNSRVMELYDGA